MLGHDPTYLGAVAEASSASIKVHLSESVASGLSIINGRTYKIGQVGSFVRIPQGYQALFGVVSAIGANVVPEGVDAEDTGRWMKVELVGESFGGQFERGVSQYPNIGDSVHLAVEDDLRRAYEFGSRGHVTVGTLSSAESIPAKVALDELVTRHSAILGSTGSGKSTTVASLLRAVTMPEENSQVYPSARVLMLDVHGEYSMPLADVAQIFSVEPQDQESRLHVPYWALDTGELLEFLIGNLEGNQESAFVDKIFALKLASQKLQAFSGVDSSSITADTPLPFSLKQLWYELVDFEVRTFEGSDRDQPALQDKGSVEDLVEPAYKPHGIGSQGPFLNQQAIGIRRHLRLLRSRLLDRRFDFILRPGPWDPDPCGRTEADLDELLHGWLGGPRPITILDLSGVPASILERLVGSILKVVYEALFWSREKSEGGLARPLLVVMEEAHRYLSDGSKGLASDIVQRIAKEGRKYGVGAMVVSQRPSEVNETVLSQCGTVFALRLSNPKDQARVKGTLPDGLVGLLDVLPVLRTGEAIVTGEAAKLPMRCRVDLPPPQHRPRSQDPKVSVQWRVSPRREEGYDRVVASWRAQSPRAVAQELDIDRGPVEDNSSN